MTASAVACCRWSIWSPDSVGAVDEATADPDAETPSRVVTACIQCRVSWDLGDDPLCAVGGHQHQQFVVHRHRSLVVLPDGTAVVAVSFDRKDPYGRDDPPDFGVYLDPVWQPPWPHAHVDWPDFGVPGDPAALAGILTTVRDRARAGKRVEIGCIGGHGRTGTTLACLAVLGGLPAGDAVAWVRANFCAAAVENVGQEAFVAAFGT